MPSGPRYWALVPAAGSGRRMASDIPKQYLRIGDRTVLEHTLDALYACPRLAGLVVVTAADDPHWPAVAARYAHQVLLTAPGGTERSDSVLSGLAVLAAQADDTDWVLVHDAARPCLQRDDIERLLDTLADDPVGGLLGVPVADTMKQVDANARVETTVSRDALWHALTPQMFRLGALRAALEQAQARALTVTDEASAIEQAGQRPRMVAGRRDNIKVTLPADLGLAAYFLQHKDSL